MRISFLILPFLLLLGSINPTFSQKNSVSIEFDIKDYDNDTLLIGYYYGDRTLVYDTLKATKQGKFEIKQDSLLKPGIYLALYQPSNEYFQFMVNSNDQVFSFKGSRNEIQPKPRGSIDNEVFYYYLRFIEEKSEQRKKYNSEIDTLKKYGKDITALSDKAKKLDETVMSKQLEIIESHPETMTARLLKSNLNINIPSYEGTEKEVQLQKYLYYRSHYLDHIDLGDPANLRTPYLDQRIKYYMEKLTPQHPDSIIIAVDYILGQMEPSSETFQFYTSSFLNKYANSNIIGYDAIYVHMIDNYYSVGKAPWVKEENLEKFIKNADKLRPILIGEQAPPITFYDKEGNPVKLYDIESEYTVMIFWAPDCGHCKKAMPGLIDFYKKFKDRGVEVLGVCTKHRDKYPSCWEFIEEKKLPWLSVGDEYHRSKFRDLYNVVSTPRLFILDKDKKILLKRVPTEQIDEVMESLIIEMQNANPPKQ